MKAKSPRRGGAKKRRRPVPARGPERPARVPATVRETEAEELRAEGEGMPPPPVDEDQRPPA